MKIQEKEPIIESLKEYPVIKNACAKNGVSRANFYVWLKTDNEFKQKVKLAIREGTLAINDLAEETLIDMIKDKEISAIKYWLSAHHKDYSKSGYIPVIYSKK